MLCSVYSGGLTGSNLAMLGHTKCLRLFFYLWNTLSWHVIRFTFPIYWLLLLYIKTKGHKDRNNQQCIDTYIINGVANIVTPSQTFYLSTTFQFMQQEPCLFYEVGGQTRMALKLLFMDVQLSREQVCSSLADWKWPPDDDCHLPACCHSMAGV